MFNWLKKIFTKKQECVVGTLIYEIELREVKPKRKYVKSGKYIGKFKSKNKKVKKGRK